MGPNVSSASNANAMQKQRTRITSCIKASWEKKGMKSIHFPIVLLCSLEQWNILTLVFKIFVFQKIEIYGDVGVKLTLRTPQMLALLDKITEELQRSVCPADCASFPTFASCKYWSVQDV